MLLSSILLFALFLALSAFFAASETALIAANPYTVDSLARKGSKRAAHIKKLRARIENLLAAILIGNTLANIAAASVSTLIFVSIIPDNRNQAVLLATAATTVIILFFGEINPKTFAAHNPLKVSLWVIHPIRLFLVLFYPLIKAFTLLSSRFVRRPGAEDGAKPASLNEEEIKIVLASGVKGLSSLRSKMISGVLDIGSRSVKEIVVPRSQVKAIEIDSGFRQILETILSSGYSRYPVFKGRMDNIEGLIHAKDIVPYLVDNKEFEIRRLLRKPLFVPESAPLEKVLIQMQDSAVHMAFVVDEFGSLEGLVTLEDIIEEIVGEIQDEYDDKAEEQWFHKEGDGIYIIKGNAPVKEISQRLPIEFPDKVEYTTLAGFLLFKFGRIPHEKDSLDHLGHRFTVEKMNKRHISLVRVELNASAEKKPSP
jgi:putative hemolysin